MPLYYDASKNPEGACLDGVPLRDLTEEEFAELPAWLRSSVEASEFYRKTKPRPTAETQPELDDSTEVEPITTTTTSPEGAATTRRRRE